MKKQTGAQSDFFRAPDGAEAEPPDDARYLEIFMEPIRKCMDYKPKFGISQKGEALSLSAFKKLYGNDLFYSWIGLDSELMYAAHKAAGGMTSIYRQIGVSSERLFRAIISDAAAYRSPESLIWSYHVKTPSQKIKKLSLDGRLCPDEINNPKVKAQTEQWLKDHCKQLKLDVPKNGIVFEVRQGYKSRDSKRQNADIDNAAKAWAHGYLPVFAIFSGQIDSVVVLRYQNNYCGILTGICENNPHTSLYGFSQSVLDYDLSAFFARNGKQIKCVLQRTLESLLRP
jgi:hypothetical protein